MICSKIVKICRNLAAIFKNPIWPPSGISKIWKHWFLVSVVFKHHLDAKLSTKGQRNYTVTLTTFSVSK